MRKQFLFSSLLLFGLNCVCSLWATEAYSSGQSSQPSKLVLWFSDGTNASIQLFTKPLITFKGDQVHVSSPVSEFDYSAYDIIRFTYIGEGTSIEDSEGKEQYQLQDEKVVFGSNIKPSDIKLYSEDGKQVPVVIINSDRQSILSLTNLPHGVYILSVKGKNTKILKR